VADISSSDDLRGINPSLEVISALCEQLDDPQTRFAAVQVVGTNGKTSTTRVIEALLRAEGLRAAMTTSPALVDEYERIQVDGAPLTPQQWERARNTVEIAWRSASKQNPALPQASDFEIVTAMAFSEFAQRDVEAAVVEAGIGGTWDSTCILNPAVVVITSVSLEHTAILGDSIEAIARDKAGAIKLGSTLVLSAGVVDPEARQIIEARAHEVGAVMLTHPLEALPAELPAHIPTYQYPNIEAALTAAEALLGRALSPDTVPTVLETLTFPGRFEVLRRNSSDRPVVIFDGAHNPEAAQLLADTIIRALERGELGENPLIALGVYADKDLEGIIKALDPIAAGYLAVESPNTQRALSTHDLIETLSQVSEKPLLDTWDGVTPLLITGSLSLYGAAQRLSQSVQALKSAT